MVPRGRVNKQYKIYATAYNEKQSQPLSFPLGRLEKKA